MPPAHKADLELTLLRARESFTTSASAQLIPLAVIGVVTQVTVVAGIDAARYELRDGGATGTVIHEIIAPLAESVSISFPVGLAFNDGLHAILVSGTTPDIYVTASD